MKSTCNQHGSTWNEWNQNEMNEITCNESTWNQSEINVKILRDLHLCFGLWRRGCICVLVYGGVASIETCICVLVYEGVAVFVFWFMGAWLPPRPAFVFWFMEAWLYLCFGLWGDIVCSHIFKLNETVFAFPMLLPSSRSKNQIIFQISFPLAYVSTNVRRDVYFTYFR
jgi:hypothetical protein